MILALWISVGVIVVLAATFAIVLFDDWQWRRHIENMAETQRDNQRIADRQTNRGV
jgi:hypothetical protein